MVASGSQIKDYHAIAGSEPDGDWYAVMQDGNEGTPANATIAVPGNELYKAAYKAATEITIASGVLTVTQNSHKVQPQSGTADDVDTISGMKADTTLALFISDSGTDTITYKHGTGNISCFGGADIAHLTGLVWLYYDGTTVYVSGGGGPTPSAQTITTADVTGVAGNEYNCTIAGLTAHRNLTLPVPSAAGEEIRVNILDGDATYALILKGVATVTINGGSAATEWSRLFIANESVTFRSTSVTNWNVVIDGRIANQAMLWENDTDTTLNNATDTKVTIATTPDYDNAGIADEANSRMVLRRAGTYFVVYGVRLDSGHAIPRLLISIRENGSGVLSEDRGIYSASSIPQNLSNGYIVSSAGDIYELYAYQNTGVSKNTQPSLTGRLVFMTVKEQLGI